MFVAFARAPAPRTRPAFSGRAGEGSKPAVRSGQGLRATADSVRGQSVLFGLVRDQSASPASLWLWEPGERVLPTQTSASSCTMMGRSRAPDTQPPRDPPLTLVLQILAWANSHADMNSNLSENNKSHIENLSTTPPTARGPPACHLLSV